jgi:serine protease Do
MILALASMACSFSLGTPEATPTTAPVQGAATTAPVQAEATAANATAPATATPAAPATEASKPGAVTSLDDVKSATIQIIAEGTFVDPQVGLMLNAAGAGSGFIIDPSGIAITNNHVVTGSALLKVYVAGESKARNAKVLGVSECSDLAVIDIDGDGYPYLQWEDAAPKVGLDVYAAGFPLGEPEFSLTRGIISKATADGETNWASVDHVMMHDATINPGNSGGPLVTADGKVVGVNYAGNDNANQYFAISPDEAKAIIAELESGKDVTSLGINGQAVRSEDGSISGIWVSSVKSGSPADKTGIKAGDIVTNLENIVLSTDGTMADYCDILRSHRPTDTLSVSVLRFADQTFMDGQVNGRPLEVSMSFAQQLGDEVDQSGTAATDTTDYTEYVKVTDNSGAIEIEIPREWGEVDGSQWETTWGSYNITAPAVAASASLDAYNNTWDESGVFFAASSDMGRTGGYMQLIEGVRDWYKSECRLDSANDYKDNLYEGRYELWKNCGANNTYTFVLAARPIQYKTSFLVLVELRITKDADLKALDHILQSFVVKGDV